MYLVDFERMVQESIVDPNKYALFRWCSPSSRVSWTNRRRKIQRVRVEEILETFQKGKGAQNKAEAVKGQAGVQFIRTRSIGGAS